MENIPADLQFNPPPPPPPARSRKGIWIGLGIAVIVLCLCSGAVVLYNFRTDIPILSGFFPSPTPTNLYYENTAAGISLNYPLTWKYSVSGSSSSGYGIVVASSQDIIDNLDTIPPTGAAFLVQTQALATSNLSFTVDASSMTKVLDYVATSFSNFTNGQNVHAFTLSGLPAASGVYTATNTSLPPSSVYLVTILRNTEIILIFSICPQSEWAQYQPVLDGILNSMKIVTVP